MEEAVQPERLGEVELFSDLSPAELGKVAAITRHLRGPMGTVIAQEHDVSSKFFVLLDGTVTVHRSGHHVADLGPGDFFGEAGTMNLTPRNASVIATSPVEVAVLMGWDLRDLLAELPGLRAKLEAANAERMGA